MAIRTIAILPTILGIFEIIYATKLLENPPRPVQPSQAIAIMEICCILFGGVIQAGVGIFALVTLNDPTVKAYLPRSTACQINLLAMPTIELLL